MPIVAVPIFFILCLVIVFVAQSRRGASRGASNNDSTTDSSTWYTSSSGSD